MAQKPNFKVFSPLGWVIVIITALAGPIVENYVRHNTDLGSWAEYASLVIVWIVGVLLAMRVSAKSSPQNK